MSTRTPDCGTRLADGVTRGSVWGLSWGLFSAETGGAGFQAARSISMSVSIQALNVGDIFLSFPSSSRLMPCLVHL